MGKSRHRSLSKVAASVAAVLTVGAALVVMAPAAAADEPAADLSISVSGRDVVSFATKDFVVRAHNNGPADATGIVITIDASGLDRDVVEFALLDIPECDLDAAKPIARCHYGADLPAGGNTDPFAPIAVTAVKGTAKAGSFTVTVESESADPIAANNTFTVPVRVQEPGADLLAVAWDVYGDSGAPNGVAPGGTGSLLWFLANQGSRTVKGASFGVELPPYVSFVNKVDGCTYNASMSSVRCQDPDVEIGPGEAIVPDDDSLTLVKVAANAPGPVALQGGLVGGAGLGELPDAPERDDAQTSDVVDAATVRVPDANQRVAIQQEATDGDPEDNSATFAVHTAANRADLAVTAGTASGRVGETVKLDLTLRNNGPADVSESAVTVVAPSGTDLTDAPDCVAETPGRRYLCTFGQVPANTESTRQLSFRITGDVTAGGTATLSTPATDANPANNTATLSIKVLPGTPEDGGPSATPTATASPSPSPGSGGGQGGGSGSDGGSLPVTGVGLGLIGLVAAMALAGGVALRTAGRRRAKLDGPRG